MKFFGLTKVQFELLDKLAIQPLKKAGCKVWIFGSRAINKHQKFSDIDLLYESDVKFELSFILCLI